MSDDSRRHYPPPGFGAILSAARRRRGLSQRGLAGAAGISAGYLAMLETDRRAPSESVAELLVDTLRLTGGDAETVLSAGIPDVGRDWTEPPPMQRGRGPEVKHRG